MSSYKSMRNIKISQKNCKLIINKKYSNENCAELMKLKIQQTVNDIENNEKKYKREREQKLKKEIEDRIEKANKLQEYNQLLNSFISNHKESFCLISEFLSDYMEEIIRMDTALIKTQEQNIVIPGIDYESLSKKRNKYKSELASLFKDFNAYTKHEMEINKEINRRQRERQNNDFKPSLSFRDSNVNDSLEFC